MTGFCLTLLSRTIVSNSIKYAYDATTITNPCTPTRGNPFREYRPMSSPQSSFVILFLFPKFYPSKMLSKVYVKQVHTHEQIKYKPSQIWGYRVSPKTYLDCSQTTQYKSTTNPNNQHINHHIPIKPTHKFNHLSYQCYKHFS